MAVKTSSGLRDKLLVTGSFKSIFDGGSIQIYGAVGGTASMIPATADASPTSLGASLLCTVKNYNGGTPIGLTFASTASGGVVTKTTSEVWSGVNSATGTALFYRLVTSTDTGNAVTDADARVQGTIGTAGADLNLSSVALTSGATQTIDYYSMAIPTA